MVAAEFESLLFYMGGGLLRMVEAYFESDFKFLRGRIKGNDIFEKLLKNIDSALKHSNISKCKQKLQFHLE